MVYVQEITQPNFGSTAALPLHLYLHLKTLQPSLAQDKTFIYKAHKAAIPAPRTILPAWTPNPAALLPLLPAADAAELAAEPAELAAEPAALAADVAAEPTALAADPAALLAVATTLAPLETRLSKEAEAWLNSFWAVEMTPATSVLETKELKTPVFK